MEIFDTLTRKVRVVYASKGKAWVKHNGIKVDENGKIIGGRYVEMEKLSIESLIEDGLKLMEVEDEIEGVFYVRDLSTGLQHDPLNGTVIETVEKTGEEAVTETVKAKPESFGAKAKRKRRTKAEIEADKKKK